MVDLPAPLPPESVVTSSSKSKVRAKKPFQLIKVKDWNLPRFISFERASGAIFSTFCKFGCLEKIHLFLSYICLNTKFRFDKVFQYVLYHKTYDHFE